MSRPLRVGLLAVGSVIACLAAWRVVVTGLADRFVVTSPERALDWEPDNPAALLAVAKQHLEEGDAQAASATARELLRVAPLSGEAFVILAKAAELAGDNAQASVLFPLAARRAPEDPYVRAWLIEDLLRKARYAEALGEFDTLFRVSSGEAGKLLPIFAQLSDVEEFADALTAALNTRPSWQSGMLSALLEHGSHDAVDRIFGNLQRTGSLPAEEASRWLDRLMHDGLWGEAYSRWASGLKLPPGASLPLLYNGGLETEPSGSGFDWRIRPAVGVFVERTPTPGATGSFAMEVGFSGRRVPEINVEQRLFLAPGAYVLSFRARADALHSDKGLQWAIQCYEQNEPLAVSEMLDGSFGWKRVEVPFIIPEEGCVAQRLWLRNPGAAAAGKAVSGEIWFDDFAIGTATNSAKPVSGQ